MALPAWRESEAEREVERGDFCMSTILLIKNNTHETGIAECQCLVVVERG